MWGCYAGSIPQDKAGRCQIASTSQGNDFKINQLPQPSELCVCTTCGGTACDSILWLPGPVSSAAWCPYRPPLHFLSGVTTFFQYPPTTGQQPAVANLQGGQWCKFQAADATWVTGYERGGKCHAGNGQSSTKYQLFCPFMVNSCTNACNIKGLVNPNTQGRCSCDYWCHLYGDCCGQYGDADSNSRNAWQVCPNMKPFGPTMFGQTIINTGFVQTRSCSNLAGLAQHQDPCGSYRPAGEDVAAYRGLHNCCISTPGRWTATNSLF